MTKKELRKVATEQRKLFSDAQVAEYSRTLLDHFSSFDLSGVKTLHIFIPIAEKREPDTFVFIDWLAIHHPQIKIIVPKADFGTALMSSYVYPGKEALIKNLYNILEPQKGELHTGDVDMVLIPMLAFDERGYRVGYGKGFYDRFLLHIDSLKIGLSFFGPVALIDDVNEYDVRLDFCITPERIYKFNG
jgi:5-formyltetrahydrofolate cyclo-ligase